MNIVIMIVLALLGAVFGSFAGAQVWRLRASQLRDDKKHGEPYSKAEYQRLKPLMGRKQLNDRSQCLACGHALGWRDLVPVMSWVTLGGKCRYCKRPIGRFELGMELLMAALFGLSYYYWPHGFSSQWYVVLFIIWLAAVVIMAMLSVYDYKWQLLPDTLNIALVGAGALFTGVYFTLQPHQFDLVSIAGAVGILAGIYAVLYIVSKGAWIGFGDVKLGIGLGLLLGNWKLAFLALFLANLIGCILVLPGLVRKQLKGNSRIAFGPLLIAGTLASFWWGMPFIEWLLAQRLFFI